MHEDDQLPAITGEQAAILAVMHDGINQLLDNVCAYRQACLARGFSPEAAEDMAVEFHHHLWELSLRQTAPTQS